MRIQAFYQTYYGFEASFEDVELILLHRALRPARRNETRSTR